MNMEFDPLNPLGIQNHSNEHDLINMYSDLEVDFMVDPTYYRKEHFIVIRSIAISDIDKYTYDTRDALVPYLAINFVDRFLSRNINMPVILPNQGVKRNIELFAICCVSLASKTCISDFSVINLLNKHQVAEMKDVEVMETQILEGLNHMVRPVTPFTFLPFLLPDRRKTEYQQDLFPTTLESHMIFDIQRDIKFTRFKPSTVAASAILASFYKIIPYFHLESLRMISNTSFIQHSEVEECFSELKNHVIIPANDGSMLHYFNYPRVFKRSYTVLGARQKQSNKDFLAALARYRPLRRKTGAKDF